MTGIIGGTGLYQMDEPQVTGVREVTTSFGPPSSPIVVGVPRGRNVAFLARHGPHHLAVPAQFRQHLGPRSEGATGGCLPRLWRTTRMMRRAPAATRSTGRS